MARWIVMVLLMIYFHLSHCNKKQARFEVYLENIQSCQKPSPPYAKKVTIIPKYEIHVVNGTRYLSGNSTITSPTRFVNFSARTYSLDNTGQPVLRFQIKEVSCKNVLARSILMFSNIPISTRNCVMHRGFHSYKNMDLNKISHALPGWHVPGLVIHEMQLVRPGARVTEFCNEVRVQIR